MCHSRKRSATSNMTRGQVNAAGGLRLLTGQLTATSDASGFAASITGILDLGGVLNVVTVNDGLGPVDLDISATITSVGSGGIQKEGPGTLQLSGSDSNNYTGTTFVNAGTLALEQDSRGLTPSLGRSSSDSSAAPVRHSLGPRSNR